MSWERKEFENLYLIPSRNGLSRPARVRGQGHKFINMGELFSHDRIGAITMERVQMNEKELANMLVERGDLLFARQSLVAAGAGKCSIVKDFDEPTTFESHLIRVRLNRQIANPAFYHYYFKSPICPIRSIVTQGVQAGIKGNDLKNLKVHVPPVSVQNKIVSILSNYDDLIDNNNRRIALLEEAVHRLYREWFVHLRFPGHERVAVVDGVPEGWEKTLLSHCAKVNSTSITKKDAPDFLNYVDISSVTTGRINGYNQYQFSEAPSRARRVVKHGDIVWSMVRPGKRAYALVLDPVGNMIVSTGFAVISAITIPYSFLYALTTTDMFVEHMEIVAIGAAYPAVKPKDFESMEILIPTTALLAQFDDFSRPAYEQMQKLMNQNQKLREARDRLLPRLMNGSIPV